MSTDTLTAPTRGQQTADQQPAAMQPAVWPHAANAILGAWLASAPAVISPHPAGLVASDVAAGVLIVALSALACSPRYPWAAWVVAGIGLWLMVAPLVLWAPTAAAYQNETLVGSLVIAFAVIVPGSTGGRDHPGPDVPPGWTYNPSSWLQRAGIIALALVQFYAARHLAAYQFGHIPAPWDPFFGDGTRRVLDSDVSKAFPVSDAGLGAFTYVLEALTGLIGGTSRWRTMPWAVLLFGVLVVPVGVVSIVLVVLQPVAVGAWCALCLLTAALTVFMISPAADEIIATSQFLLRARAEGRSLWRTFWQGGELDPAAGGSDRTQRESILRKIAGGMELSTIPWNLALCAAVGVALMATPSVLGLSGAVAGNDQLVGALVATFAVIGFGEAVRAARWVNVLFGVWLMLTPWVLADGSSPRWHEPLAGLLIILLTIRRGHVEGRFGGWSRYVV